jgi:uncharacterized protein involved in exopolysaccharide biosynthesis
MSLGSLARIVWANRLVFFIVFGVTTAASVAFCLFAPALYRADAMLLVTEGKSQEARQPEYPDFLRYKINSQLFVIESEDVVRAAIAAIGAEKLFPELADDFDDRFDGKKQEASTANQALLDVKKHLNIAVEKDTQILRLSYTHEDPELAARFLNALIDVFLKRQAELSGNAEAPAFFRGQVARYQADYEHASAELSNFSKAHSTYSVEQQRKLTLERRDETMAALATTKGSIIEKESKTAKLQDTLTQLKRRVGFPAEVRGPKYQAPAQNDDDHSANLPSGDPPLLLVRVYQDTAQNLVTLNADIAGLHALEENQRTALASIETELASLSSVQAEFDRLKREVDQAAKYLEAYNKRAAEAQIDADWDTSEKLASVKVVQRANVPLKPVFPQKVLFIALGLLVGAFAGAGLSVALHNLALKRRVPDLSGITVVPSFLRPRPPASSTNAHALQRHLADRRGSLR